MIKISKKLKLLAVIVLCSTVTVLALAISRRTARPVMPKGNTEMFEPEKLKTYDPALLNKFSDLARAMDFNRSHCTYEGLVNITDGADTSNNVHDAGFLFCRSRGTYYYRAGNTETIHQGKLNVFIQHDQQKVVLSSQEIKVKAPLTGIPAITAMLRSEDYVLTGNITGSKKTLAVTNEHHITCKEIAMTYDTVSGKLEHILTRFSDFGDPLNKQRDRVTDVKILQIEDKAKLSLYPGFNDVLIKTAAGWQLTARYANYELIIL